MDAQHQWKSGLMGADNNEISATQTKVTRDFGLFSGGFCTSRGGVPPPVFPEGCQVKKKKRKKRHICDILKSKTDEKMAEEK